MYTKAWPGPVQAKKPSMEMEANLKQAKKKVVARASNIMESVNFSVGFTCDQLKAKPAAFEGAQINIKLTIWPPFEATPLQMSIELIN